MKRDAFIVDTKNNVGYLVHEDGGYTSFLVATGQRRVVHYIGRTYNAQTPARSWTVNSSEIKSDRITFGRQGRFLRLTNNKDDLDTPYGIHSHAYVDKMLAGIDRYRSMGCIIVADTVLDNIIATFEMNDEKLNVVTLYGFGDQTVTDSLLRGIVAMNR